MSGVTARASAFCQPWAFVYRVHRVLCHAAALSLPLSRHCLPGGTRACAVCDRRAQPHTPLTQRRTRRARMAGHTPAYPALRTNARCAPTRARNGPMSAPHGASTGCSKAIFCWRCRTLWASASRACSWCCCGASPATWRAACTRARKRTRRTCWGHPQVTVACLWVPAWRELASPRWLPMWRRRPRWRVLAAVGVLAPPATATARPHRSAVGINDSTCTARPPCSHDSVDLYLRFGVRSPVAAPCPAGEMSRNSHERDAPLYQHAHTMDHRYSQ